MRHNIITVDVGSTGIIPATRLSEDPNRSVVLLETGLDYPDFERLPGDMKCGNNVVARGCWPMCITKLRWQLVYLALMLPLLAVWSTAMAAEKQGFVVRPDQAPRFSGPAGMEGLITEVLATREQTGGAFGIWRYEIEPKGGPPSHIHREADEFFYVLSGEFHFQLGDRSLPAPAGSFVFIPRGAVHTYQNTGSKPGVLLGGVTPAGFEGYFMQWKGADEETHKALMKKHGMEVVGPPLGSAPTTK